jgi:hypothetical protein
MESSLDPSVAQTNSMFQSSPANTARILHPDDQQGCIQRKTKRIRDHEISICDKLKANINVPSIQKNGIVLQEK